MQQQPKQLRRSNNKVIAGVCAGLAEYVDLDPMIMRIIWVVVSLFTGIPVVIYIVLIFVMPPAEGAP